MLFVVINDLFRSGIIEGDKKLHEGRKTLSSGKLGTNGRLHVLQKIVNEIRALVQKYDAMNFFEY